MKPIAFKSLALSCFLMVNSILSAQEYGTDKGSLMISGILSFTDQNGTLYEDIDGASATTMLFNSSVSYFLAKGLFGGIGMGYSYQGTGANRAESVEIGPHLGYAFGKANSKILPYITGGIHYLKAMSESDSYGSSHPGSITLSGRTIFGGVGAMFKIYDHWGIVMELNYGGYKLKEFIYQYNGNNLNFSVGMVGFIF